MTFNPVFWGTQTRRKVMRVFTQFHHKPLLFQDPERVISCHDPRALPGCFHQIETALNQGYYVAGFLSYEAGYIFEKSFEEKRRQDFPLLCFGVYRAPIRENILPRKTIRSGALDALRINIAKEKYFENIQTIRDSIAQGDVYQVTYCIKLLFDYAGDPLSLYARLLREQPVPYPAYLEAAGYHILSLSPEMFVCKNNAFIQTKPMKGTWPRGKNWGADAFARIRFQFDEKNRAENVMIADLLRNDLGRVATKIRAPRLFEVAQYQTLYQMTSTVCGRIDPQISMADLFAALFPSGSVTGAPKISAMKIIRTLEPDPRRIYTGAIGYITPSKDIFFNIPIRTLLIRDGRGEMGIGGGIVWDSTPQGEWDEGLLKARFVTETADFKI